MNHLKKNFHLLPKGSYLIFYTPSSQNTSDFEKSRIEVPDFKYRISKNDLEKFLIDSLPSFFKQYKDNSNQVGLLHLSLMAKAERTNYLLFPQKYERLDNWECDEFCSKLQETINKKEQKYLKNQKILRQNNYPYNIVEFKP